MPQRDSIHDAVKRALVKDDWQITDDPYVIAYGERFLFVNLAAQEQVRTNGFIGAERANIQLAIEIKGLRGRSAIAELEQAIGQYMLYQLLLNRVDPNRTVYLAVPSRTFRELFSEPIGELVIRELPLQVLVVNIESEEVEQWIPTPHGQPSKT